MSLITSVRPLFVYKQQELKRKRVQEERKKKATKKATTTIRPFYYKPRYH